MPNEDEAVGTSIANDQKWLLGGLRAVGSLRLEPLGHTDVAGRATRMCRATPRVGQYDDDDGDWNLHAAPAYGATEYEIDVDVELGLILRVTGFFDEEQFSVAEVVDLDVNGTFAEDLFVFASPDGSQARSFRDLYGEHHVDLTPRRLAELAGFALFVSRSVPDCWEFSLRFVEGGTRPPRRPFATMNLQSPDNLRGVTVG